jgi:HEAT repeat protein
MSPFGRSKPDVKKMEMRNDVKGLIKALTYKDSHLIRKSAAQALGRVGDAEAIEALVRALRDGHRGVRREAAAALGEIADVKAVEPLIQALNDEDSFVRPMAALSLARIGEARAVQPLIQALKDPERFVRSYAIWGLRDIAGAGALDPLIQTLMEDKDRSIRREAALALGQIGASEAIEPLKKASRDKDEFVRKAVRKALQKMGVETPARGIHTLEELYTEIGILDEMAYVSRAVEELQPHGADASRALAELIEELLECRNPKLTLALVAAKRLQPTPELIEAVRSVQSARPLAPQPIGARFSPEIAGGGQVGWTDGTADGIRLTATQVLEKLTGTNAQ